MIYIELFLTFVYIGLFSFGGGYTILSLIQMQTVDVKGWLTMTELTDIITISEMTPGPLAINAATFVGMKMSSVIGAVIATLGLVLPAVVIVLIIGYIYTKFFRTALFQSIFSGIRPATLGFVLSAALSIVLLAISNGITSIFIFAAAFIVLQFKKLSPTLIILLSGVVGIVVFSFI